MTSRPRRAQAREHWADLASVAALLSLWLWPMLAVWRGGLVISAMDSFCQHLPDYFTSARLWRGGLPLWNPYLQCGMPQVGYAESAALYPGLLFFRLFSPTAAFNWLLASHWLALGLGMYAWARALKVTPLGSFCAALVALLCPLTTEHLPYSGFLAFGWMPWLGLLLTRLQETLRWRWAALAAGAVALPFYAGHPQYWVSWLALCAAYSAFLLWRCPRARRPAALALLAAAWAAGLLLTLPQALPALDFLAQGPRAAFRDRAGAAWVLGAHQSAGALLASLLFNFKDNIDALLGPEGHAYVGLLTLLLAWTALARRKPGARFWAAAAAAGAAAALSAYTGLAWLVYRLPLVSLFHDARRETLLLVYPLALLAGMGLDAAGEAAAAPERGSRVLLALWNAALAVSAMMLGTFEVQRILDDAVGDRRWVAAAGAAPARRLWLSIDPTTRAMGLIWAALALFGAWAVWRTARGLPRAAARAALAGAVLLSFWPQLSRPLDWVPTSETPFLTAPAPPAARLIEQREASRTPQDRVATFSRRPFLSAAPDLFFQPRERRESWETLDLELLLPNVSQLFGLNQVGLWHDAYTRRRAVELGLENWQGHMVTEQLLDPRCALLPLLGVRYVLVHRLDEADPRIARWLSRRAVYARLLREAHASLWERKDVLPRFRLLDDVRVAPPDARLEGHLVTPHPPVDWRKTAYIDGIGSDGRGLGADLKASSVRVESYEPDEIRLSVDARGGAAFLVDGDAYDAGWKAAVDGVPARVARVDLFLRGLRVPAGRHEVVLRYEPKALARGLWGALAGVLVLLAAAPAARRLAARAA